MDEQRGYPSVTIPVHPDFLPAAKDKDERYRRAILDALADGALSLTDLAHALGYKGISRKLARAVEDMLAEGALEKVPGEGMRSLLARPGERATHSI